MSDPYIGEIRIWPGTRVPNNFHLCDGTLLSIANNSALYALIGTTYGGDGQTTFALPDLRNRIPVHQGAGPGLTPRPLGTTGGETQVTLTTATMPIHTHPFNATTTAATSVAPSNTLTLGTVGTGYTAYEPISSSPTMIALSPASIAGDGGQGAAHANMMPTLAINFIIALFGLFPVRN